MNHESSIGFFGISIFFGPRKLGKFIEISTFSNKKELQTHPIGKSRFDPGGFGQLLGTDEFSEFGGLFGEYLGVGNLKTWVWPPSQDSSDLFTGSFIFLVGDPEVNLHLPLLFGVGSLTNPWFVGG